MPIRKTLGAIAVAMAVNAGLVGCSGSTSGLQDEYESMSELLSDLGTAGVPCVAYVKGENEKIGTREYGECSSDGMDYTIFLMSGSPEEAQELLAISASLGSGYLLVRGNYAIRTADEAEAKDIAAKSGMAIQ